MSFEGKVAVITGAGHGIGEATAKLFAKKGANVVCNSISDSCRRVAREIRAAGGEALHLIADITDAEAVKEMMEKTVDTYGGLDILVNNAAWLEVPSQQPIEDAELEDWERMLKVNLTGHFHCCKYAVPYMKGQGYGKIVNIGSGAGVMWSRSGIHSYAAAKAGLGGLTRQLAKELASVNINVNCVAPGLVDTYPERRPRPEDMSPEQRDEYEGVLESIPARRIGTPRELANVIVFMASDEASYIHGQTLPVDGGHWMK
jgi:NAD(P)-dependent dehydrogenase (short-subunit alcohol dehydrogenase family)